MDLEPITSDTCSKSAFLHVVGTNFPVGTKIAVNAIQNWLRENVHAAIILHHMEYCDIVIKFRF